MKGFFIEVSNNLLDPKHCKKMGDAVWLFMWFIDKMTTVNSENGKVLGGKPIRYKDVVEDLGISRSTYNRWMKVLKEEGYVKTLRTPYGSCIVVLKAKKRFKRETTDVSKMTQAIRSSKNESSIPPVMTHQSSDNDTSLPPASSDVDTSNKTIANILYDNTVDTGIISDPQDRTTGFSSHQVFSTSGDGKTGNNIIPPAGEVAQQEGNIVNEAIALFLPIFPGDFSGKSSAFAKKPTRDAVSNLLKRYSVSDLKELIRKYDAKKTDKFRPEAGTVYEFCTFKLAKIEAFLVKDGGLWAQKSISSSEHRADSDKKIQAILEAGREKTRLAKEKWLREHPEEN